MAQGLYLSQKMSLQQVLAPQLQQSLALLQAPTLELKGLVEQELQQNPVLEEVTATELDQKDKSDEDGEISPAENSSDAEPSPEPSLDGAADRTTAEPVDDFQAEFERLTQLDQEWRDHFAQTNLPLRRSEEEEEKRQYMFDSIVAGTSLQENLLEQMRLSDLNPEQRAIAELIIGNIDDYGYLKNSVEELAVSINNSEVTFTRVDGTTCALGRVTSWIENFNPPGETQPRIPRRQTIQTLEAAGEFLSEPGTHGHERDSSLTGRRQLWFEMINSAEGTLIRQGTFNRLVRVVQFNAWANPGSDRLQWSLVASFPRAAEDTSFSAVELKLQQPALPGALEQHLVFSGRVAAPTAAQASDKLSQTRRSTLQLRGFNPEQQVRSDLREETVPADDGCSWVQQCVEEEYRAGAGQLKTRWVPSAEVLAVLKTIQGFHPPGVGARDLQECLRLQLEREGRRQSLEYQIISQHMDLLGKRRLPEIARALGLSVEQVQKAVARIGLLEPRPGRAFLPDNDHYILPEVFVTRSGDQYVVTTNNEQVPHLRISNTYKDLMSQPNSPTEVREYIREKIRAGKFLIKSLQQRQDTIRRIAEEIVKVQREFMDKGVAYLKPLTMVQVAGVVGVHETTVSRAVSGKYMQTPQGLFEMKYFFTSGIQTSTGQGMSNTSVKDMIADLFGQEDPHQPLSDQEVVKILGDKGIQIARRTVAKYRSELNILPSNLRKVY